MSQEHKIFSVTYSSTLEFTCDLCKYLLMCVLSSERQKALSLDYFIVHKESDPNKVIMSAGIQNSETSQRIVSIFLDRYKQCIYLKRHVTGDNLSYVMMISSGRETDKDCTKLCIFLYIKIWGMRVYFPLKYSPHN